MLRRRYDSCRSYDPEQVYSSPANATVPTPAASKSLLTTTTCHHHTRYTTTSPMTTTMAAHVLRPRHWRDTTSASGAGNSPVNTAPIEDPAPYLINPCYTMLDNILKRHVCLVSTPASCASRLLLQACFRLVVLHFYISHSFSRAIPVIRSLFYA